MNFQSLARTGVQVSPLCLGCMMFGGRTDEKESFDIIDHALEAGINFLDTANAYTRGRSEEVVGKALKRNGVRDQIVLASKFHWPMHDTDPNMRGNSRRHLIDQCEQSLRRLQTDWIDLYQIHRPMSAIPIDETLRAIDDLVRAGKVRYIGTSTFAAWQLVESLWASKELGLNRVISEQPPYHPLDRRIERELIPAAQTYGIAIIPWSPLASGFLTGKYQRGQQRPEDVRLGPSAAWADPHFTDAAFDVLDVIAARAKEKGCTTSQLALAWCMNQPGVASPIIGPRTMEQLKDNLGALDVAITDEDRQRIDEVAPPGKVIVPYYEADFGRKLFAW